jgi:hypothetical protein
MSYENVSPAMYRVGQPENATHQGDRGWTAAPIPSWGTNPNLVGPRQIAMGAWADMNPVVKVAVVGVALLGAATVASLLFATPQMMSANHRKKMFRTNGACATLGKDGPFLFPKDRKYPVPTVGCAATALAYAAWPNNIESAPAVIRAMKRTKWAKDSNIRAQMKRLAKRYSEHTHKKAPRV